MRCVSAELTRGVNRFLIHAALILRYWQLSVVMARAAALADTLLLRYAASRLHTTLGIG